MSADTTEDLTMLVRLANRLLESPTLKENQVAMQCAHARSHGILLAAYALGIINAKELDAMTDQIIKEGKVTL